MKQFNITGSCIPDQHYMVDLDDRMKKIKVLVDNGDYFVINRPRQFYVGDIIGYRIGIPRTRWYYM